MQEPLKQCINSDLIFAAQIQVNSHVVKKNSRPILHNRRTRKPFIGKSSILSASEAVLTAELRSIANKLKLYSPFTGDVHAMFIFQFNDYYTKDGVRRRNLPDLSNLIELPQDCLQRAGIIDNDTQIVSLDGSRRVPGVTNQLIIVLKRTKDDGQT